MPRSVALVEGRPEWGEYLPHPALRAHVSSYWSMKVTEGPHTVRILPDACIDVTFDLGAAEPTVYVSGPQQSAKTYRQDKPTFLLGARLMPGAAPLWLGPRVSALEEGWTRLELLLGQEAAELAVKVHYAKDTAARVAVLDQFLIKKLLARSVDERLLRAIDLAFQSGGQMPVPTLAKRSAASERTLGRLFSEWVGLSPKRFLRIVRFQQVLRRLTGQPDWGQLAVELGYFDQAHLIRDLRELFGSTPRDALAKAHATR